MKRVEIISDTQPNFARNPEEYASDLSRALGTLDSAPIESLIDLLDTARQRSSTVFLAGNGGSAATASHAAIDWMFGSGFSSPPLRAICLSDSSPAITATSNDFNFLDAFVRPLSLQSKQGDLLVIFSASGNSPNLLAALEWAEQNGMQTAGITGFDGGKIHKKAGLPVHVETSIGDYGIAEDCHLALVHMVKESLIARREMNAVIEL